MRLFIGVWLSEPIRDEVMNYIDRFRKDIPGWKWTKRQNLHFTLKFLGEISEHRVSELNGALESAAVPNQPFTLQVNNLGFFPERGIPRIVWLGVGCGELELIRLADLVESNCLKHGFGKADKPFQPHLTIARAKEEAFFGGDRNSSWTQVNFENTMLVKDFSLIKSCLSPRGAVYKTVNDYNFGKRS